MKNKFPFKTVKLINSTAKIIMFDDNTTVKELKGNEGVAERTNGKLFLNSSSTSARMKQTFLHELIHLLDDTPGLRYLTEAQVEILSMRLLHFMQNNPQIIEYLVKK